MSDGLLRLGEVVALKVADIDTEADGSGRLFLARSKTDQEARGATIYLGPPTVEAINAWREAAGVHDGALFPAMRRGNVVLDHGMSTVAARAIVKRRAAQAGIKGAARKRTQLEGGRRGIVGSGRGVAGRDADGRPLGKRINAGALCEKSDGRARSNRQVEIQALMHMRPPNDSPRPDRRARRWHRRIVAPGGVCVYWPVVCTEMTPVGTPARFARGGWCTCRVVESLTKRAGAFVP